MKAFAKVHWPFIFNDVAALGNLLHASVLLLTVALRITFKVVRISGKVTQIFLMVTEVLCKAAEQGKLRFHPLCYK